MKVKIIIMALIFLPVIGCRSSEQVAIISYSHFPLEVSAGTNAVLRLPQCIYISPREQIVIGEDLAIQNNVSDSRLFLNIDLMAINCSGTNLVSHAIQTLDGDEYQLVVQKGSDSQLEISVVKNSRSCVAQLEVPPWDNVDVCVWHEEPTESGRMAKDIFIRRLRK